MSTTQSTTAVPIHPEDVRYARHRRNWRRFALIVLAILAVLALLAAFLGWAFGDDDSSAASDKHGVVNTPKQAQQALTVDPAKVSADYCNNLVKVAGGTLVSGKDDKGVKYTTVKFDAGSTHPLHSTDTTVKTRLWGDATNVPLAQRTLTGEQRVICTDPGQAAMAMNGLGVIKVNGHHVNELNDSWIQAQGTPAAIATWANGCMTDDVAKHLACAETMSYTAYLLGMFHDDGVHKATTAWNYHVLGPVAGKVPPFAMAANYTGYFLRFSFTEKSGSDCLSYGFNVGKTSVNGGDQRLAAFSCAKPKAKTSTPTKPKTVTHKSPPPSHGKPPKKPPVCTSHCGGTPPPPSKTCESVFGPSSSGDYPNCHKDGTHQPSPPPNAPGQNPQPAESSTPGAGPGSNQCYSDTTGEPVAPVNGQCPPGSSGS